MVHSLVRMVGLCLVGVGVLLVSIIACDDDSSSEDGDHESSDDDDNDNDVLNDDASNDDDDDNNNDDNDDDDDDNDDDNNDDDDDDDDGTPPLSYPILSVEVDEATVFKLTNSWFPKRTGDLWANCWGPDDRLYTCNGDGFGFGLVFSEVVFNIVDGDPPDLTPSTPRGAYGPFIAHKWGPEQWKYSRKPTGMVCIDGDIYLFFQNLSNFMTEIPFGDAPHASLSMTPDLGETWFYNADEPMFTDHVFTTGFFLDFGKCQEHAIDEYTYVYGLDYNWRYTPVFPQTKMFLARVPSDSLLDRERWEFVAGFEAKGPIWSEEIDDKVPVLEDDSTYTEGSTGISQGTVLYLPEFDRYLYSTRAIYEWIFYEAPEPWGPWTKIAVQEWLGGWREDFHPGYPAIMASRYLDADNRGGWMISSLSDSWFDGTYYSMCVRRFRLTVADEPE